MWFFFALCSFKSIACGPGSVCKPDWMAPLCRHCNRFRKTRWAFMQIKFLSARLENMRHGQIQNELLYIWNVIVNGWGLTSNKHAKSYQSSESSPTNRNCVVLLHLETVVLHHGLISHSHPDFELTSSCPKLVVRNNRQMNLVCNTAGIISSTVDTTQMTLTALLLIQHRRC